MRYETRDVSFLESLVSCEPLKKIVEKKNQRRERREKYQLLVRVYYNKSTINASTKVIQSCRTSCSSS